LNASEVATKEASVSSAVAATNEASVSSAVGFPLELETGESLTLANTADGWMVLHRTPLFFFFFFYVYWEGKVLKYMYPISDTSALCLSGNCWLYTMQSLLVL
jgi:hypothetical protein